MDVPYSPLKGPALRRVVLTGIGLVSPLGIGLESNWKALVEGKGGISLISRFDTSGYSSKIAGEIKDFDPLAFINRKDARKMDAFIQYAVAAAQLAVDDSGIKPSLLEGDRSGISSADKSISFSVFNELCADQDR